jgi:hypothetical protein
VSEEELVGSNLNAIMWGTSDSGAALFYDAVVQLGK